MTGNGTSASSTTANGTSSLEIGQSNQVGKIKNFILSKKSVNLFDIFYIFFENLPKMAKFIHFFMNVKQFSKDIECKFA